MIREVLKWCVAWAAFLGFLLYAMHFVPVQ